jgi:hypothetical protein
VLLHAAVELVRKPVNCGVHIGFHIVGMDGAATNMQRRLGRLSEFLHRQYAMHVNDVIEVA